MTEVFGRLAPGADLEAARTELRAVHASILAAYPEAYSQNAGFRIDARLLCDQIASESDARQRKDQRATDHHGCAPQRVAPYDTQLRLLTDHQRLQHHQSLSPWSDATGCSRAIRRVGENVFGGDEMGVSENLAQCSKRRRADLAGTRAAR
jgi:hypothetical protein